MNSKSIIRLFTSLLLMLCLVASSATWAQDKLIILHSNDTHSRIEPMPATDKQYPSMGGVVNRKAIIDSIRQTNEVLLIDAGDIVQGTPYFNLFEGRTETECLNNIGYEVGTIGNHEFDNGVENLDFIVSSLNYPIVACNYDFTGTKLENKVKPYVILKKKGLKIGIIGVCVNPEGLISKDKFAPLKYLPAIETANKYAKEIRQKCDLVIALTHIGFGDDKKLAAQSEDIDLVIGGHSHTFLKEPEKIKNKNGKEILVTQVGKNGVYLGKIEVNIQK